MIHMKIFMNNSMYFYRDNFFDDIEKIRKIGLETNYNISNFEYGWKGFRSDSIKINSINELILDEVCSFFDTEKSKFKINSFFHYSLEKTKEECIPSFEVYKWHTDGCVYAGVVYLMPQPQKNSGTILIKNNQQIKIENIYNRILFYAPNLLHGPENLFGKNLYDGRLIISFFIEFI